MQFKECPNCGVVHKASEYKDKTYGPAYCQRCGGTEIDMVSDINNPYCANRDCSHMMTWGEKPTGFVAPHP